jgi:hypothetical protein
MARLLVLCMRPQHVTAEEAESWAAAQVTELVQTAGVSGAVLTRLESVSERHGRQWDWLLELEIALPANQGIDDWLGDLRLLGMRPAAVLAGEIIALRDA